MVQFTNAGGPTTSSSGGNVVPAGGQKGGARACPAALAAGAAALDGGLFGALISRYHFRDLYDVIEVRKLFSDRGVMSNNFSII